MVYIFSMVCGVLVLRPEIKPTPFALEVQSLNHWTAREIPEMIYFYLNLGSCSTYCLGVEWAGGWNLTFQKRCLFILPLKWWEGRVLVSPTLQTFHSVIRGFHGKDPQLSGFYVCVLRIRRRAYCLTLWAWSVGVSDGQELSTPLLRPAT